MVRTRGPLKSADANDVALKGGTNDGRVGLADLLVNHVIGRRRRGIAIVVLRAGLTRQRRIGRGGLDTVRATRGTAAGSPISDGVDLIAHLLFHRANGVGMRIDLG